MASRPSHDTLIHCEECGEDYSSTYRACPFCGAKNDPRRITARNDPRSSSRYIPTPPAPQDRQPVRNDIDDTYVFEGQDAFDEDLDDEEEYYEPRPKGGKRLAPKEGGGFDMPPINWPRLITFLCSLIIIVAALVIVFTFIYPQLHRNPDSKPDGSAGVSAPPSQDPEIITTDDPGPIYTDDLPVDPTDVITEPPAATDPVTTAPPAGTPATVVNASSGLRVRSGPGTSYEVVASLYDGSPISVIAPSDNGWYNISFTGSNGATIVGYIMGDYISTVAGPSSPATQAPAATDPPTVATQPPAPSSGGNPTVGQAGIIVGADGGLRVRSGPGTSYEIVASLLNNDSVTVLAAAEGGWYQIRFSGSGGVAVTGYILGEYISTN